MSSGGVNNRLINSYQHIRQPRTPNNIPIRGVTPQELANMSPGQIKQLQLMQSEEIEKQKKQQEMRRLEKIKLLEKSITSEEVKNSILQPINILSEKKLDTKNKYAQAEKEYLAEVKDKRIWEGRTNQPYKSIIKDNKYIDLFLTKTRADTPQEQDILREKLIVHKVTNADKNYNEVEGKYQNLKDDKLKHDNELKVIYSTSNEVENKKKFEYNHIYKYHRMNANQKGHEDIKRDAISLYKKAQQKEEAYKEQHDEIMKNLLEDGILNENDIREIKEAQPVPKPTQQIQSTNRKVGMPRPIKLVQVPISDRNIII